MARALWLAGGKPPKQFTVRGEEALVVAIKNDTLQERLLPRHPETMTVRDIMGWAELVRRVTTGYGASAVLIDRSFMLDPLILTLQRTLRPYKITLQIIQSED